MMFVFACLYSLSFLSQDMDSGEVKKKIQEQLILSKPFMKNNGDKSKVNLLYFHLWQKC